MSDDKKPSMLERLAPKISVAHASVNLTETNSLLRELVEGTKRLAVAVEAIVQHAFDVNLSVIPEVEPAGSRKLTDPELRDDDMSELDEILATVELLEQEGYEVPKEVYARLGIESPRKSDEPVSDEDDDTSSTTQTTEPKAATKDFR